MKVLLLFVANERNVFNFTHFDVCYKQIYSPAITPDNEYNVLHFEKDRTGLEDQFSPYNHLEH